MIRAKNVRDRSGIGRHFPRHTLILLVKKYRHVRDMSANSPTHPRHIFRRFYYHQCGFSLYIYMSLGGVGIEFMIKELGQKHWFMTSFYHKGRGWGVPCRHCFILKCAGESITNYLVTMYHS